MINLKIPSIKHRCSASFLKGLFLFFILSQSVVSFSIHYDCGHLKRPDENGIKYPRPYIRAQTEDGQLMWEEYDANSGFGLATHIAYDRMTGGAITIGFFEDSLTLFGFKLTTAAERSMFMVRCNNRGEGVWAYVVENTTYSNPFGIFALGDGSTIVGFSSTGEASLAGEDISRPWLTSLYARFDPEGKIQWVRDYDKFWSLKLTLSKDKTKLYGTHNLKNKTTGEYYTAIGALDVETGDLVHHALYPVDILKKRSDTRITTYSDNKVALVTLQKATLENDLGEPREVKQLYLKVFSEDLQEQLSEKLLFEASGWGNAPKDSNRILLKDVETYKDGGIDVLVNFEDRIELVDDFGDIHDVDSYRHSRDIGLLSLDNALNVSSFKTYGDNGFDNAVYLSNHSNLRGFGGCYNGGGLDSLDFISGNPVRFFLKTGDKPRPALTSSMIANNYQVYRQATPEEEALEEEMLRCFPNPVLGGETVTLEARGLDANQAYGVAIYNAEGVLVRRVGQFYFFGTTNQTQVPMDGLTSGVYVLQLERDGEAVGQSTVVVE